MRNARQRGKIEERTDDEENWTDRGGRYGEVRTEKKIKTARGRRRRVGKEQVKGESEVRGRKRRYA